MKKEISTKKDQQKIAELTAGWQRTQADFINFKRQAEENRLKTIHTANSNLILEILPILDNFQLAAKHIPEKLKSDNWALGIKQIEKQLESTLFGVGLERISSLGQHFNPNLHEAVETVKSDCPEGEIVDEVLTGYKFKDEVIRPSKVKVSSGKK